MNDAIFIHALFQILVRSCKLINAFLFLSTP